MSRQILNGWKEISSYIERSVRTVQRWEARLGLPVYRPALKDRSAVVAFSDELDRWISRASPDAREEDWLNGNEGNNRYLLRVLDDMSTLRHTGQLVSHMRLLQENRRPSKIYRRGIASRARVPLRRRRPRHGSRADLSLAASAVGWACLMRHCPRR